MRRTVEERKSLLVERVASGLTIKEFCERKGISIHSFKGWVKTLSKPEGFEEKRSFLPIVINARQEAGYGNGACSIKVGKNAVIECNEQTSPAVLEMALRIVVAVCGQTSQA